MTNATLRGKPDAGNPHVRFDEGEVAPAKPGRGSLLYKIAVCAEKGEVFQHFGHTPEFLVCDVEDGRIVSEVVVPCGESGHGALVDLLVAEKVEVLLCGGIGGGALSALAEAGIKVVGGARGGAIRTVMAYLAGRLETEADFMCKHHHEEGHSCASGEHHCGGHCGK